jgi:hypothetical protein
MFKTAIRVINMVSKRRAGKVLGESAVSRSVVRGKREMHEMSVGNHGESMIPVPITASELPKRKRKRAEVKETVAKEEEFTPKAEDEASPAELEAVLAKPPPVNSEYLPLPWKGRLGYVSYLITPQKSLTESGLLEHLPQIFQSHSLLLPNLPHIIHSRTPTPSPRPFSTRTSNQEPSRQIQAS